MQWTPEYTFACTYIAAALSGLAVELNSNKPLPFRRFVGVILLYGGLGSGFGMLGYEFLGGQKQPWRVVACGMLVGVRALKINDIRNMLVKLLSTKLEDDSKDKDDKDGSG